MIVINAENICDASYFCGNQTYEGIIESPIEIFCNIIHVFTVTFDQLNVSLLN